MAKTYWDRWLHKYLPTQAKRTKWSEAIKNVQEGDVVMIADDDQKARWKKGIITNTHKSKDGQVRSAVVKTTSGEYTRPVIKLAVMDVRAPEIPATEENPRTENTKQNTATKRSSNQPVDEACTSKQRKFMGRTSENILKGYEFGKKKP